MSRMLSKLIKFAAILGALGLISTAAQAGNAYQGYVLFNQTCFLCHGNSGEGDGPLAKKLDVSPADLTDESSRAGESSDRQLFGLIQGTIKHGSGTSAMPRWGLAMPAIQIDSIVAYIRFLQRSKHALPGDPNVGKLVYLDKCAACHGRDGRGNGPLAEVLGMKAKDHTNSAEMNKNPNSYLVEVITYGSAGKSLMPGWKEVLSEEEIEGVVSYIRLLSTY
ncbi:MAG: cytochrome c [Candidatus Thiodiazotropha sp. (ex Dulcina madagascariensis)]|nr:cytochrome c [Candidatus Thiodiazotropha sp. (ex Dulcina madagascariensis)]MCU7927825.1 cytochrome c [Candidatus Thiodiazotropha sp. (ex Dulcina madagascariensis)]